MEFVAFVGFIEFVESMETGDTIETGRDSWRYSRDEANEIATGFALATTWSDCRALLAMTRGPGPRYLL